jgi:dCMP deaminase
MINDIESKYSKYMQVAKAVSMLSKDPSTKVGAVIVGRDGEGGPWGYNGAPRGSSADEHFPMPRTKKLRVMEHAERNAIFASARTGFPTSGCTLVCTHYPCCDCARAIIQSGFARVVTEEPDDEFKERWHVSMKESKNMLEECGVEIVTIASV